MGAQEPRTNAPGEQFRHEALLYRGNDEFVKAVAPFINEGLDSGERILVVVAPTKIEALRDELGPRASSVTFADMNDVGYNPARIIPLWESFVLANRERGPLRGVGEPIYPSRTPEQLVECVRHESLLNVAFEDLPGWWLLCPYDVEALGQAVIDEAFRTHPYVMSDGMQGASHSYEGLDAAASPFDAPLPEAPRDAVELFFGRDDLGRVRQAISNHKCVQAAGAKGEAFVIAANEIATNSIRHGGGRGTLRIWEENGAGCVCEISDSGRFDDPLAGRKFPSLDQSGGRGLWLANQLCDLVQLRSFPTGTVVRLHMH